MSTSVYPPDHGKLPWVREAAMNRVVSFTAEGDIRVESESVVDVLRSGVVLLTLEQAEVAQLHGWSLDAQPYSKETTPWLYSVRKAYALPAPAPAQIDPGIRGFENRVFECGRCYTMKAVPAVIDRMKSSSAKWAEAR